MTWTTVLNKTITMPADGIIEVDGIALQGFPSGAGQWGFRLYIDGSLLWQPQGLSLEVTVPLGGLKACAKGDRIVRLDWSADTSVRLHSAFLKIKGFNNVQGV